MEMGDDDLPKFKKLTLSIEYFFQLFRDAHLSEILVRVAIFLGCVALTHTIMIWTIYNILIPLAKRYFMDRMLDELGRKLGTFEFRGYKLRDYDLDIDDY